MRDINAQFGIPNLPHSPDIEKSSNFRLSGQFFINKNCHNPRISSDIEVKLGPVTTLGKRTMTTLKKIDYNVMLAKCDVIGFFRFMANLHPSGSRIPDAWSIKHTFSLTVTFYFTKPKNRTKKSLKLLSYYCFE